MVEYFDKSTDYIRFDLVVKLMDGLLLSCSVPRHRYTI
jgi:hypothetical protein